MDFWIRSQDKLKLVNCNDIAIVGSNIYGYFDKSTEYEVLGEYNTKQRAVEVLNEMQNFLFDEFTKNGEYHELDMFIKVKMLNNMRITYEMPEK